MGHSTASGRTTGATTVGTNRQEAVRSVVASSRQGRQLVERAIDRAKITSEGNGNWQMDIEGVSGGQILDETGGSRDPMYGRGGKVYSVRAWDADYNMVHETTISGSLNDAKRELREALHRQYGTRG